MGSIAFNPFNLKIDPYTTLGVPPTALLPEIKTAYRELAHKFHPDKNPGSKVAEDAFKDLNAAYDVLKDEDRRHAYDLVRPMLFRPAIPPNTSDTAKAQTWARDYWNSRPPTAGSAVKAKAAADIARAARVAADKAAAEAAARKVQEELAAKAREAAAKKAEDAEAVRAAAARRATAAKVAAQPATPPTGRAALAVGMVLKRTTRGTVSECEVVRGGYRYNKKTYRSLSGAASACAVDLGLNPSVNGYRFWGVEG